MTIEPKRLRGMDISYLVYLLRVENGERPISFGDVSKACVTRLKRLGLIDADPRTAHRPFMTTWWRLTDHGRRVARSLRGKGETR